MKSLRLYPTHQLQCKPNTVAWMLALNTDSWVRDQEYFILYFILYAKVLAFILQQLHKAIQGGAEDIYIPELGNPKSFLYDSKDPQGSSGILRDPYW
jgi:hypothetical protein